MIPQTVLIVGVLTVLLETPNSIWARALGPGPWALGPGSWALGPWGLGLGPWAMGLGPRPGPGPFEIKEIYFILKK